ncbi:MAG: DivIVA domain-containing protein [Myxococcales bacterium]|nr:DivIVA domain-containing protein [Myxococcales bacterium]
MKLTPLDIQQQQFRTALWGFDSKEVDAFLELIAGEFERLVRENNAVRDQLRQRESDIEDYRSREETLKETMVTATRMSDDIRENAKKEADIVVARAEAQGEQIVQNAHNRLVRVLEDLDELKRQRAQLSASLRSVLDSHTQLLEAMSERSEAVQTEAFGIVRHIDRAARPREKKEPLDRSPRKPIGGMTTDKK